MFTFTKGHWYIVVYMIEGVHRVPRKMRAQYLDYNEAMDEHVFNLRPVAGTASLKASHIISAESTEHASAIGPKVVHVR